MLVVACSMASQQVTFTGKVVKEKMSPGSKSEHMAVKLKTEEGTFVLRKKGGNPFYDESLGELVGKKVTVTGVVKDYVLMASEVVEID
jgi:hypothetical protein